MARLAMETRVHCPAAGSAALMGAHSRRPGAKVTSLILALVHHGIVDGLLVTRSGGRVERLVCQSSDVLLCGENQSTKLVVGAIEPLSSSSVTFNSSEMQSSSSRSPLGVLSIEETIRMLLTDGLPVEWDDLSTKSNSVF